MIRRGGFIVAALAALAAGPAVAQPDLDPEEPDTAAAGTSRVAPDAPPGPDDAAYDNRLRASMAAARGFQGPMDGGWTLSAGTQDLYAFQLIDKDGAVEGAWRDLRRAGALDASGFIDLVERSGADVTFHFAAGSVATLHAAADGRWVGQLVESGRSEAVKLKRRGP